MRNDAESGDADPPSKSARKRDATDLQKLGAALLEFTDEELDRLVSNERLRGALAELRRLTSNEARRRQSQFIGKLMRNADVEPLRRAIEAKKSQHLREASAFKDAQRWRERMIGDETQVAAWIALHPDTDTPAFRSLVRNARREQETGRDDKRAFRELFRAISAALAKS
jgi:ribosome-associated protein